MIETGCIVRSMAGRDAGRYFVVLRMEEDFAHLVDGKAHVLEKPKKKRMKHLQATARVVSTEEMMTNKKLRQSLSKLNGRGGNGELVT